MKYLIVDTGLSEAIAIRLANEGEEVYYYTVWQRAHPEQADLLYGKGILEDFGVKRIDNWEPYIDKVDVIVFPDMGWGQTVDKLRKEGKIVWGTSSIGERLENERMFAKEKNLYDYFPKSKIYSSVKEAIDDIKSGEFSRPVIKVNKVGDSSIKTYVASGKDDAIDHLKSLIEKGVDDSTELVITEYIEGVEVAIGLFVSPNGYVFPWNMNFEHKRLFPGEIGPMTGEMGTVIFNDNGYDDSDKLFQLMFGDKGREKWYSKYYGVNYIDINTIVSYEDGKPYFLEYTARFGYPHILIMLPAIRTPLGKIFHDIPKGLMKKVDIDSDWLVGVAYNAKGYPFACVLEESANSPVYLDKPDFINKHIPAGIYKDEDGVYRIVPSHGRAIVSVGKHPKLEPAILQAYKNLLNHIHIPDGYFRTDIGYRIYSDAITLHSFGYMSSPRFLTVFDKTK